MVRVTVLALHMLLCCRLSASRGGDSQRDDCTNGFMSIDRIHALMNQDRVQLNISVNSQVNSQALAPGMNFTCSGNIYSWIFGAIWNGYNESFTELQIWRSNGDRSYTKVGSTTIMVEENTTKLYEYPLSSPLPFQERDILGFYQPAASRSQLELMFGNKYTHTYTHTKYYTINEDHATSHFNVTNELVETSNQQLLISIKTDSPDCVCGFMSMEKMRILLGLDSVGEIDVKIVQHHKRLQITPDMNFTCDGMITKWIIGARFWRNDTLYPELQLWRKIGSGSYHKINGTLLITETSSDNRVFEYNNSPPIPFQAGDIVGLFIPSIWESKIKLRSEDGHGPTNYYIETNNSVTMSPYDTFDLQQNTMQIHSDVYHPLVTVEISVGSARPTHISPTNMPSTTSATATAVGIGVGAAAAMLLVMMGGLGMGLLFVWRRRVTLKVILPVPTPNDHLNNTESGDIGIGGIAANRAAQEGVDNSHSTDYAAGSCTSSSSHNSVLIEFDNPLYGEWGPVTVQEGDHEYVELTEQKHEDDVYSTPYSWNKDDSQSSCRPASSELNWI